MDQFKELENYDLTENQQASETKYTNTLNHKRKLKSGNCPNNRISTVNARSLKHKENIISEEILNNNIDIAIITETWLKTLMKIILGHFIRTKQLLTSNVDKNRMDRRGGGIALVTQRKYKINKTRNYRL